MKKPSPIEDAVNTDPQSLRSIAAALRQVADLNEKLAAAMEVSEIPAVYAKNLKSLLLGLVNIAKFTGAATTSYCDHANAKGISELVGALAEYKAMLKRGPLSALPPPQTEGEAEGDQMAADYAKVQKRRRKGGK